MEDLTTEMLLKRYSEKTAERLSNVVVDDEQQLWSYRQAAALLHCFLPNVLNPLQTTYKHSSPFSLLSDDIVGFSGGFAEGLYTLRPAIRNAALKRFSSRKEMQKGLEPNPDREKTPLQQMWEKYLSEGYFPDIATLSYKQMIDLHQIVSWLASIEPNLPDINELLSRIKRKSVLANFEHLVISNFTGRVQELQMLKDHIDPAFPESSPIIAIYGPGGIGKSALVGKVLYERAMAGDTENLPYIYLAFDQPSLRIENPVTIFTECASQLELQYPEIANKIQNFKDFVKDYGFNKTALSSRGLVSESRGHRIYSNQFLNKELTYAFSELLNTVSAHAARRNLKNKTILITFDTFEEVQYRDREIVNPFFQILSALTEACPQLRILIAGRMSVKSSLEPTYLVKEVRLQELKMDDRLSLLLALGVKKPEVAEMVAQRVGGNPLSLRLAARVVMDQHNAGMLNDLIPKEWLLFQMDEQLIQGQLYKRILEHIHNPEVRKLAHPGMVLRKVTPAIIIEVLAPVCNIEVNSAQEAKVLFEELEQEHSLVQLGDFETLEYRPEIRQVMVRLLQQDKFEEVKLLHKKAIEYYYDKPGTESRAEELYHRLALGEDETYILNERWLRGIEQSVVSSLDEYADSMQAWLASKMSLEVPREIFVNADAIDWERNITRKVKRAILNMDLPWAFRLLNEREVRSPASPLFALEAKAFILNNQPVDAERVLDRGIAQVSQSTNRGRLAELLWLKAQLSVTMNKIKEADEFLSQAQIAIQYATNALTLTHILCQRLMLHRQFPIFDKKEKEKLLADFSAACFRLRNNQEFVPAFVIVLAKTYLKNEYPKTVQRLSEYFDHFANMPEYSPDDEKHMLMNENLRGLEKYREEWEGSDDDDEDSKLNEEFQNFA